MSSGYQAVLKMEERIIQAYKALPKEILKYLSLQEWAPCFNENQKGHWKAVSLYLRQRGRVVRVPDLEILRSRIQVPLWPLAGSPWLNSSAALV